MDTTAADWADQAKTLRERASKMAAGPERTELLRQADQLDQAIEMTDLLSVRKSRKYR